MPSDDRLVYSTDGSLPLPKLERAKPKPAGKRNATPGVPEDGIVRVGCERRRGGTVTLIYNLPPNELGMVEAALKRRCGTGGTAKAGIVELQGDHRDVAIAFLAGGGMRAKRMGG